VCDFPHCDCELDSGGILWKLGLIKFLEARLRRAPSTRAHEYTSNCPQLIYRKRLSSVGVHTKLTSSNTYVIVQCTLRAVRYRAYILLVRLTEDFLSWQRNTVPVFLLFGHVGVLYPVL
jgi:hypothetical protein